MYAVPRLAHSVTGTEKHSRRMHHTVQKGIATRVFYCSIPMTHRLRGRASPIYDSKVPRRCGAHEFVAARCDSSSTACRAPYASRSTAAKPHGVEYDVKCKKLCMCNLYPGPSAPPPYVRKEWRLFAPSRLSL